MPAAVSHVHFPNIPSWLRNVIEVGLYGLGKERNKLQMYLARML